MATRFIDKSSSPATASSGNAAGIGVGADGALYYNPGSGPVKVARSNSSGKDYYVDFQNGSSSRSGGSWQQAVAQIANLDSVLRNNDTIHIRGVLREHYSAPVDVFDVTIIGEANTPRQATEDGVATGAGATWLAPSSPTATTPLLKLREQGWTLINLFMAAETDGECVYLNRLETDANRDASHFAAYGCVFGGGLYGIRDVGGNGYVQLKGNRFQNFTGASAYAIRTTSTAIANPLQWEIEGNLFRNNKNHILSAASQASVKYNDFGIVGSSITTVIACSLTGGLNNTVAHNDLNVPADTSPNATLYVGGTDDLWYHNFGTDAIIYGVPDNS
jgi:hypothetical protein